MTLKYNVNHLDVSMHLFVFFENYFKSNFSLSDILGRQIPRHAGAK